MGQVGDRNGLSRRQEQGQVGYRNGSSRRQERVK